MSADETATIGRLDGESGTSAARATPGVTPRPRASTAPPRAAALPPLRSRLSFKQARNTALITFVLGLVLASFQILADLAQVERNTDALVQQVLNSLKEPAAEAAYSFDGALAGRVVDGLFEYRSIHFAEIEDDFGNQLARRERPTTEDGLRWLSDLVLPPSKRYSIPLVVERKSQLVGELRVAVDSNLVANEFFARAALVLVTGLVWTAALAAVLVVLLYVSITKPFQQLAHQLAEIDPTHPANRLLRPPEGHADDELGLLVRTANDLLRQFGLSLAHRSRAEAQLREREARLSGIMENVADGIVTVDAEYRIETMNRAALDFFGLEPEAALGLPLRTLIEPEDWPTVRAALVTCSADDEGEARRGGRTDILGSRADGTTVPISFGVSLMRNAGRHTFICLIQDVTERRRAEAALRESEERLKLAVTATRSAVWDMDLRTGAYWRSREFDMMLGYDEGELDHHGDAWRELMHPDDLPWCEALVESCLRGETSEFRPVYRMRRKDGSWTWIEDKGEVLRDDAGNPTRFIGTMSDVTERKRFEEQLMYLATHDRLTGLPNRSLLQDRLAHALAQAQRKGATIAVLYLDLDRFKVINDSLGHELGDELLLAVARRVSETVGPSHTVGRLGGDEFLVIAEDLREPQDAARLAKTLLAALAPAIDLGGQQLFVTPSIGISIVSREESDFQALLRHADAAMYRAKADGGNTYRFFIPEMNAEVVARLNLERRLRDAVEHGHFSLAYQPKIDLATMDVVGVEALIRWNDPDLGPVSPATFIPVAEETGLIVQLGDWVLRTAVEQIRAWQERGVRPLPIAVNISVRQLASDQLLDGIADALSRSGVTPDLIELEITETAMMSSLGDILDLLRGFRELGIRIAVDDFGTGYSSLNYLRRLPITSLKVDRSFVNDVTTSADDAAIAATIIAMGRQLGLRVIAEGIETVEQLEFLRSHGCDQMQGFLVARPLPIADLEGRFLRDGAWVPAAVGAPEESAAVH